MRSFIDVDMSFINVICENEKSFKICQIEHNSTIGSFLNNSWICFLFCFLLLL